MNRKFNVWAILRRKDKVIADKKYTCSVESILTDSLEDACKVFDISKPVILYKHENDLKQFSRVVFRKADFMDAFDYDSLEMEIVRDKKKKDNVLYM